MPGCADPRSRRQGSGLEPRFTDAGAVLLTDGLAVPRYDSTDGYGEHSREDRYHDIAADPVCQAVEAGNKCPAFEVC
jgi:hypothetical protein